MGCPTYSLICSLYLIGGKAMIESDNANLRKKCRYRAIWTTIVIWSAFMLLRHPISGHIPGDFRSPDSPILALGFAALPGYALALLYTLYRQNRHRLDAVFRPNRGRLIGAVSLTAVTPMVIIDWLPWIPLGLAMVVGPSIIQKPGYVIFGMICATILSALWYPVSCLLVSGITSLKWRFGGFCLVFWACYASQVLAFGVGRFL